MSEPIDWKGLRPWQRDQLIAEKVMGVTSFTCTGKLNYDGNNTLHRHHYYICQECSARLTVTNYYLEGCKLPDEHTKPTPPYSTGMDAAWLVLLKLVGDFEQWSDKGTNYDADKGTNYDALDTFADVLLRYGYSYAGAEIYPALEVFAIIKTWTPERICIASLRAVGVEINE